MTSLQGQSERLPCGCVIASRIVDGERQFAIEPCSKKCEMFKFVIDETERQGKELKFEVGKLQGEPKDLMPPSEDDKI